MAILALAVFGAMFGLWLFSRKKAEAADDVTAAHSTTSNFDKSEADPSELSEGHSSKIQDTKYQRRELGISRKHSNHELDLATGRSLDDLSTNIRTGRSLSSMDIETGMDYESSESMDLETGKTLGLEAEEGRSNRAGPSPSKVARKTEREEAREARRRRSELRQDRKSQQAARREARRQRQSELHNEAPTETVEAVWSTSTARSLSAHHSGTQHSPTSSHTHERSSVRTADNIV